MMNIKDYYLDINALFKIDERHSNRIFDLYYQLTNGSGFSGGAPGSSESYINTLLKSGYLKNYTSENRDEKIDIINE